MKTRCRNCRKLIDYGQTYCEDCLNKITAKRNKEKAKNTSYAEKVIKTPEWKATRRKVILRDNGCCVLCLKRKFVENRGLQVHHIYKRVERIDLAYDMNNLVTLCRKCHEEVEKLPPLKQLELLGDFNKEEVNYLL